MGKKPKGKKPKGRAPSADAGTAAAVAEQLGSVPLGESVERKDNDVEQPNAKNGTPSKLCSACDKKSNTLKKCTACKCVWYCDKECQNKHRKEHKKECRLIKKVLDKRGGKLDVGTEKDLGPLGKLPTREECPICMQVLPIHAELRTYYTCCGKTLCAGCDFQHQNQSLRFLDLADEGQTQVSPTCAFCREPTQVPDEEIFLQLQKRAEHKDAEALRGLAVFHGHGRCDLPVDQAKCIELLREAAGLGSPFAHYKLATFYHIGGMGLEQNREKAIEHWKKAAGGGSLISQHNLGCAESVNGDIVAAMRHFRLAASGGYKTSMDHLIICFENGDLRHSDLAETLQVMYRSRAEMKSENRDMYIAHLKMIGKYEDYLDS